MPANQGQKPQAGAPGNPKPGMPQPGQAQPGQAPGTFSGFLNTQYGQGNPFGMQSFYGGNPLQTAQTMATRAFQEQLAGMRSRFGAAGTGNSDRAALAEGEATGAFGAGLGDVLAQRGQGARQFDVGTALQAILGGQQNNLAANAQLQGLGAGLTGLGQEEQQIPNLGGLESLLAAFQTLTSGGRNTQGGKK